MGAFLDWGLDKDLLLPRRGTVPRPERVPGQETLVHVMIDERSNRIVATCRLNRHLNLSFPTFSAGQAVKLMVESETPLGYKAIINHTHLGLSHHSELAGPLSIGQSLDGFVRTVRPDGKIDIGLDPVGRGRVVPFSEQILEALEKAGGYLPYHDASTPEQIRTAFGMSKKAFKQAIGGLYRKRQILIEEGGLRLVKSGRIGLIGRIKKAFDCSIEIHQLNIMNRLRPSGGYRDTCSFQTATLIYDATVWFWASALWTTDLGWWTKWFRRRGRGDRTSLKGAALRRLFANGVAAPGLRGLSAATPTEAMAAGQRGGQRSAAGVPGDPADQTDLTDGDRYALYARWLDHEEPAVRANALICLIHQANYLLDRKSVHWRSGPSCRAVEVTRRHPCACRPNGASAEADHRSRRIGSDPPHPPDRRIDPREPEMRRAHGLAHREDRQESGAHLSGMCANFPDRSGTIDSG